eukprot:gnl/MRDRNA2_/MRDRNA2_112168_c0_seq1.p1 gnl/MRDRNA2_/MRDRNA2_112168_c0~~gnl/MRDRNA2_/MRDRNA2_112168_c0_seq1.p1  ORF type:complete len:543 (+),score=91.37 gnl/MRDRNA2_/MRDRNA2_112168_c0_seq1:84-1712(+)
MAYCGGASHYTALPLAADRQDVACEQEFCSGEQVGCRQKLTSVLRSRTFATVAFSFAVLSTVSFSCSRVMQNSSEKLVDDPINTSDDTLLSRAHMVSHVAKADLDGTTVAKPGQGMIHQGAARPPSFLNSLRSPSHSRFAHRDCTSSWASYWAHSCSQAMPGRSAQARASTQEVIPATPEASTQEVIPDIPTMLKDEGVGIIGRWKEVAGNFVSYPPDIESNPPRGIIHFLGGAFVGAAPHFTYRYLLDALSENGYIVVTTPYRLAFEYIPICKGVLSKFDIVAAELSAKFGPLPVIGMGHSCGALLQTLMASELNVTRAANVLISFNNKPVTEAIPGFDDFVAPISSQVMSTSNPNAAGARDAIAAARNIFDGLLESVGTSEAAPQVVKNELVPAVKQGLEVADQIPDLFASIAAGTSEFTPTPKETREWARNQYRVNRTFILQFENDAIDESPEIAGILRQASMESSNEMEVELKVIGGTHVTPLTQNVFVDPPALQLGGQFNFQTVQDPLSPLREQVRENFLQTVNEVKTLIVQFLAAK